MTDPINRTSGLSSLHARLAYWSIDPPLEKPHLQTTTLEPPIETAQVETRRNLQRKNNPSKGSQGSARTIEVMLSGFIGFASAMLLISSMLLDGPIRRELYKLYLNNQPPIPFTGEENDSLDKNKLQLIDKEFNRSIIENKKITDGMSTHLSLLSQYAKPRIVVIQSDSSGHRGGSGIIYSSDGIIITNRHVILDERMVNISNDLSVTLFDGRKFKATLLDADSQSDLAAIKIDDVEGLPTLKIAKEDAKAGDLVMAIGHPNKLGWSSTFGIISATNRVIPGEATKDEEQPVLQTDTAINPGNSGGPLLDMNGEVTALNTKILYAQNIGLSIPSSTLRTVIPKLIKN